MSASLFLGHRGAERHEIPADDLTRHAICLGMTGSGKTGLCLALLEEAALAKIPIIALDPKGDVANLLLSFPGLPGAAFEPWVGGPAGEPRRARAEGEAARWRAGIEASGQPIERVARLREACSMALYTPGSDAGRRLSLLGSLDAPGDAVRASPEALRERAQSAASALLMLAGLDVDPGRSREHVLVSTLLTQAWSEGRGLDLAGLARAIQTPPFRSLGVLDLEAYYPAQDRFELVLALNHLLSMPPETSPLRGAALDVGAMLATGDRPALSVIALSHLGDGERKAFVTALLGQVLGWMRGQRGHEGLRALLFMDEVGGYLPPIASPATKQPFLALFKQARAFGLGVVVATQNPADIDYKALSNAGTWLVGRLQTARDRMKVREGMSASSGDPALDGLLAGLEPRQFVHLNPQGETRVFTSRWALSYLRGPLALDELSRLDSPPAATGAPPAGAAGSGATPVLSPSVRQAYLPCRQAGDGAIRYAPGLLGVARIRLVDRALGVDERREVVRLAPAPTGIGGADWASALQITTPAEAIETSPVAGATHQPVGAELQAAPPKQWTRQLTDLLLEEEHLTLWRCDDPPLVSRPGEAEEAFRGRLSLTLAASRAARRAAVEQSFARRRAAAEGRLRKAEQALARRHERASQNKADALVTAGAALLGGLFGGARGAGKKAARLVKDVGRVSAASHEIDRAADDLDAARAALASLLAEEQSAALEAEQSLSIHVIEVYPVRVEPSRSQIEVLFVGLGWLPWREGAAGLAPGW
jgi:hypothetical protein